MKKTSGGKPILSFWALLARSSVYKISAVFVIMAVVEILLFERCQKGGYWIGFQGMIYGSRIQVVFLAALGLIFFVLSYTQGVLCKKGMDTMRRLRLSGKEIFWIKTIYNLICFILFFGLQVWLIIIMSELYQSQLQTADTVAPDLFLAFYQNDFLHCLLPLQETGKWVRNILLLLAFSMEAGSSVRKTNIVFSALLYVITVSWFICPIGAAYPEIACGIVYAVVIGTNLLRQLRMTEVCKEILSQ